MIALLLMNYGSPSSIDDVGNYLSHIMNGRSLTEEMVSEATERYRAMGVADPLGSVIKRQADALKQHLSLSVNTEIKTYIGSKHSYPFVEDTVQQIVNDGATHIISLPLTPLYSKTGVGAYQRKVQKELENLNVEIPVLYIDHWHLDENFVSAITNRVNDAISWLSKDVVDHSTIIFTTHSQPGNPEAHVTYTTQFKELASAVTETLSLDWRISYRSAAPAPQKWLGPDVTEVIKEVPSEGKRAVIICDLLTVTENVEVYYDIGATCQEAAAEVGIECIRTVFLNDSYDTITALSEIISKRIKSNDEFSNLLKETAVTN